MFTSQIWLYQPQPEALPSMLGFLYHLLTSHRVRPLHCLLMHHKWLYPLLSGQRFLIFRRP